MISGSHANWFTATNQAWVGDNELPYWLLIDASGITSADSAWRTTMTEFHRRQGPRAIIAWFGLSAMVRVMVEMFVIATPAVVGKTFASEQTALSWLVSQGLQEA